MIAGKVLTIMHIAFQGLVILYCCNCTMEYRSSRIKSNIIFTALYFVYGCICLFGITALNIAAGLITIFVIIYCGYKISVLGAAIRSVIFIAFAMFGELTASIIIDVKLDNNFASVVSPEDDIIFSCVDTMIFLTLVTIFKNVSGSGNTGNGGERTPETLWLTVLPISTCAALSFFNQLHGSLSKRMEFFCIIICVALIISDLIAYVICEHIADKNMKIQQLQDAERRRELDELYSKVCGIRHDLKNHFLAVDLLIDEDPKKAKRYIGSLMRNQLQSIISFVKTDNDTFNAIANAKIAVCERDGIKVQMRVKNNVLSRLDDDEIGIIFGNLFDNAIEAARKSAGMRIDLDVSNKEDYLSIVMTNSIDASVLENNAGLKTTKKDRRAHGYGTKNIRRIVTKHDGILNYFEEGNLFGCQILIPMQNDEFNKLCENRNGDT